MRTSTYFGYELDVLDEDRTLSETYWYSGGDIQAPTVVEFGGRLIEADPWTVILRNKQDRVDLEREELKRATG